MQVDSKPSHLISFFFPFSSIYSKYISFGLSISINVSGIERQPSSYLDVSLLNFFILGLIKQ